MKKMNICPQKTISFVKKLCLRFPFINSCIIDQEIKKIHTSNIFNLIGCFHMRKNTHSSNNIIAHIFFYSQTIILN